MVLTVLEINYSTNVFQYPMIYQYIPTTGSNSNYVARIYNRYQHWLPNNTLLFTDIIKLGKSDYPASLSDILTIMSSPNEFKEFIQDKFIKFQKRNGVPYSISNNDRTIRKITEFNIDTLLKIFFKLGNKIYLPGGDRNRPFIIEDYNWVGNSYNETNITNIRRGPTIIKISVRVDLKLSHKSNTGINMKDLRKMDCNARRERINRIYSILTNKNVRNYRKISSKTAPAMWRTGGARKKYRKHKRRIHKCRKHEHTKKKVLHLQDIHVRIIVTIVDYYIIFIFSI